MSSNPSPHQATKPATSATTAVPSALPAPVKNQFDSYLGLLKSPTALMLIGIGAVYYFFLREKDSKNKIAKGKWGGASERTKAKEIGKKQVAAPKKNACSLYINKPEYIRKLERGEGDSKKENKFRIPDKYALPEPTEKQRKAFNNPPTIWIPDTQQSTIVLGKAGSGKTYSAIDPMLRSALDQGHTTIVYDFKFPGQAKGLALYAIRRGYKVHILAPGYPQSSSLNLLDFIEHSRNAVNAEQVAEVIIKNCQGAQDSGDPFFTNAGKSLVTGLFLLTKWIQEYRQAKGETDRWDDLLTTACILNMPNLAARLQYAMQNPNYALSRWTMQPLTQLMSTHGSSADAEANKTETSIVATAQDVFGKFIKQEFCQASNLPVEIDDKTLVILGLNQENRYSIGPLLATATHMLIAKNIVHSKPRRSPLVVGLDELASIYLPALSNWLAEARSAGFNAILGIQTLTQLVKMYGDELANIIITNCGNKIFFHPGNVESAKMISEFIGEEEVIVSSTSTTAGKNGSTTKSKSSQAVAMIAPNELLQFIEGQGIAILAGSKSKKQAFIPQKINFQISQEDLYEVECLEAKWDDFAAEVAKRRPQLSEEQLEKMFSERSNTIEMMFPEPPPPPPK
jgi:type IV secretory pathway TraG/TraD family ATPase VirD4